MGVRLVEDWVTLENGHPYFHPAIKIEGRQSRKSRGLIYGLHEVVGVGHRLQCVLGVRVDAIRC